MGLYGERIGSLTVITSDPSTTKKVDSQLKAVSADRHASLLPVPCKSMSTVVRSTLGVYNDCAQDTQKSVIAPACRTVLSFVSDVC